MSKNILIVEDDMILAVVLERYLNKLGFEVIHKTDCGEDAVKKAREQTPDMIFMDIKLNGEIDGIDAMHRIRDFSKVPVVYLTGNSDVGTRQRAQSTEYIDYLVKPVMLPDIRKVIEKGLKKNGNGAQE